MDNFDEVLNYCNSFLYHVVELYKKCSLSTSEERIVTLCGRKMTIGYYSSKYHPVEIRYDSYTGILLPCSNFWGMDYTIKDDEVLDMASRRVDFNYDIDVGSSLDECIENNLFKLSVIFPYLLSKRKTHILNITLQYLMMTEYKDVFETGYYLDIRLSNNKTEILEIGKELYELQ